MPLGWVNPNPALFDNRLHVYLAPGAERVDEIRGDGGTEETTVELVAEGDLDGLVAEGRIHHALVVAAIFRWRLHAAGATSAGGPDA